MSLEPEATIVSFILPHPHLFPTVLYPSHHIRHNQLLFKPTTFLINILILLLRGEVDLYLSTNSHQLNVFALR